MRSVRHALLAAFALALLTTPTWAQIEEEELGEMPPPEVQQPGDRTSVPEPLVAPRVDRRQELEALAEQHYLEGDLDAASKAYQQLAELSEVKAEQVKYLVSAAWLTSEQGQVDTAREILSRALTIDPTYEFPAQNYAQEFVDLYYEAKQRQLAEQQTRAGQLVRSAVDSIGQGHLDRARTQLQEALKSAPDNAIALYNLGLVDSRAGRSDDAIAHFERLLAIDAGTPGTLEPQLRARTLSSLGLLYYDKNFLEDARTHFTEATRLDPQSEGAWNNLGLTLRRLDRETEAIQAFQKAAQIAPDDPSIVSNLASSFIRAEKWLEAVSLLIDVTERNPVDGLSWLNLALAQRGMGNIEGARESLSRVMALDPENRDHLASQASTYLAVIEHDAGNMPATIAAANKAVNLDPQNLDAWVYLGLAQLASDDATGALASFERALTIAPTRPELHNNVGTARMETGDYEGAETAFRQALAIRPDFQEAQANLDVAVRRLTAPAVPVVAEEDSRSRGKKRKPEQRRLPKPIGVEFDPVPYTFLGETGALVARVQANSPGARGGLRKDDVVMSVDGRRIESGQAIIQYLYREAENEDAIFDILRDGKPKRVRIRIF
ncbi:MAG: tetratricopeptide repeat protein [Thermoanaerobaculia bacterium]|nr:tetratricopeptide repeat protein [Thermoanaerobaculia bacterium]